MPLPNSTSVLQGSSSLHASTVSMYGGQGVLHSEKKDPRDILWMDGDQGVLQFMFHYHAWLSFSHAMRH